jgi:hypothetical protein
MEFRHISLQELDELMASEDSKKAVILAPRIDDIVREEELVQFAELMESLGGEVSICITPTAMNLIHVQLIFMDSTVTVPVLFNFEGWQLPIELMDSVSNGQNVEEVFQQSRYRALEFMSVLLGGDENWSNVCWLLVRLSPEKFNLMYIMSSEDDEARLIFFENYLAGKTPHSPERQIVRLSSETSVSVKEIDDLEDANLLTFRDGDLEVEVIIVPSHTHHIEQACSQFGWTLDTETSSALQELPDDGEALFDFSGQGKKRTKPFSIPQNINNFTYSWTSSDPDFSIELYDLSDPSIWVDFNSDEQHGSTIWYGSGKFFFSVDGNGPWSIRVSIDEDSYGEVAVEEFEVDSTEIEQQQSFVFWHMTIDEYILVTPTNVDDQFTNTVRQANGINFVEDLGRGFALTSDNVTRINLSTKQIAAISDSVRNLDEISRSFFPSTTVDKATGEITFNSHIDGSNARRHFEKTWKNRVSISKALDKAGAGNGIFLFAAASKGTNPYYIFQCSTAERMQQIEQWVRTIEAHNEANAPKRNAQAWFDEGQRRGLF